ncbi:ATP phosphoribosyltransferase [Podosphaera aphanis]|nr:ATP phosphoribosyltransferase [Podosphaera aphanis]
MDLVQHLEGRLLFAVPKKGRLLKPVLNLLEGADIQFKRENRLDIALVKNLPIALVFLPAADIPTFVGEGRVSLGITGRDVAMEHASFVKKQTINRTDPNSSESATEKEQMGFDEIMDLGFGDCRLQVQVPENGLYQQPIHLIGKNIGTSFAHLTEDYFAKLEANHEVAIDDKVLPRKLKTKIIELSGSVEAACALGVADGIVDLVESGETMKAAGLRAIDTIVSSTAVLIKSRHPSNPQLVELIASRIKGIITAQKYVLCQYNVHRSKLPAVTKITPGRRAPTISPLEDDGWVAVSCMVPKNKIATVLDQLSAEGASDILVLEIKNSRII